jgi:hypothetical protein
VLHTYKAILRGNWACNWGYPMILPVPIFVGFLPKATQPRPDWLKVASVREVCSVSECISKAPDNWLQHWRHNALGFYDTEEITVSVIDDAARHYDLYAYELFPFSCLDQKHAPIELALDIGRVPASYEFLGYDIVSKSSSDFFECSPLSCNHAASDFATNAHCLLDDESYAHQALLSMSKPDSGFEPGPYYLFKVYRKKRA